MPGLIMTMYSLDNDHTMENDEESLTSTLP